jgi:hypothetical protein
MAERRTRVSKRTANKAAAEVAELLGTLEGWQKRNPNVADYRVTEALEHLRRVSVLVGYLVDDRDPEGDAARAKLRATRDAEAARGMADAVWSDLRDGNAHVADVSPKGDGKTYTPPTALLFHYASRDVRLTRRNGAVYATITAGPGTGREWWSSAGAEEAVKAMVRDLYGVHCAHEYGTGRDSCPGCDYTEEQFEDRYAGRLGMMPANPLA